MGILNLGKPKPEKQYEIDCPVCYTTVIFKHSQATFRKRSWLDGGNVLEVPCPLCKVTSRVKP